MVAVSFRSKFLQTRTNRTRLLVQKRGGPKTSVYSTPSRKCYDSSSSIVLPVEMSSSSLLSSSRSTRTPPGIAFCDYVCSPIFNLVEGSRGASSKPGLRAL